MICTPFTGQPVKGVFFMRYSYEFKVKCVEMYERGEYPDTPIFSILLLFLGFFLFYSEYLILL